MDKPVRKHMRLANYDYTTPGVYFVTICSHNRIPLFGNIESGVMNLSLFGEAVSVTWQNLPQFFNVRLDEYTIMPNHLHGILWINPPENDQSQSSFISIIKSFKSLSSKRIHQSGFSEVVWQRSYYETIIRNKDQLNAAREYIKNNPINWAKDSDFVSYVGQG
jgi:REP element-mobilizing transposase RayT